MITVGELIEILKMHDPDRFVVMSKDAEGNDYSPLDNVDNGVYAPETTWNGDFGIEVLTLELNEQGFDEEDVVEGVPAIGLWPVN